MNINFIIKKQFYCLIVVLLLGNFLLAQNTIIKGQVTDSLNNPVPYANVIAKDSTKQKIIKFTTTDLQGNYRISIKQAKKFALSFSALSYKTETYLFNASESTITKNVVLYDQITVLNEVIVQTDKPITVKKDTIIYKVSAFTKGNETVVEDLLKNLPGINVEDDGTIKIGNQEVEKVMVEGDDFFKKGYKLLTKNLNADVIDKVEIYQKYSNNKLLKDIEDSNKIALNLTLKKDRKIDWFGNANLVLGATPENTYLARANLMRFGKKAKHYFLTNLNTIGENYGSNDAFYVDLSSLNEVGTIGNGQQSNTLLNLEGFNLSLKRKRYNFNNLELLSLNSIFKLSEKAKLKTNVFFNWDENRFSQNSIQNFSAEGVEFTNTEQNLLFKDKFKAYGELDFDLDISKNKLLEIDAKFTNSTTDTNANLNFNSTQINELLNQSNERIDFKTVFTNKLSGKKVLALSGRYIYENMPQDYIIDTFLYQDLFEDSNAESVQQISNNTIQVLGFEAHLLNRKKNDDLLEYKVGFLNRTDKLNSTFNLIELNNIIKPEGFSNRFRYNLGDLYASIKYKVKHNKYSVIGKIEAHQLFNSTQNINNKQEQTPFYINPSISLGYKINENNNLNLRYSQNVSNTKLINVFDNFILTNFRGFYKGLGEFDQISASTLSLNYSLGKWSSSFFANASIVYSKSHDFFSTNSTITPNYSLTNTIIIDNQELWIANLKIDRYFNFMSSNLKLKFQYLNTTFKNIVNSTELREVENNSYQYGFEIRSAFNGVFNYHIGSTWNTSIIKTTTQFSNTDNSMFLDLNFNFSKNFNSEIQTERYYFGNLDKNKTYYFLDFETKYKFQKKDITLTLTGKNLFNTKTFREINISDISTSTREYRLLPRFILLGIDFRF